MTALIVALDFNDQTQALSLVDQLNPSLCALKVGSELFTRLGPAFVRTLVKRNFNVFLDLKFHDIPNTVASACKVACDLGVWMLNVHASGGVAMMQAARRAVEAYGSHRPLLIAVTILTSMTPAEFALLGVNDSLANYVAKLATLAQQSGLDGVVCSALEVSSIKSVCGKDFLTVTPGIRLPGDETHDQQRVLTPKEALQAGSDYIVMGRSITRAKDPRAVIDNLFKSM